MRISDGALNCARYHESCPSLVSRRRSASTGRDATNCTAIITATTAIAFAPASNPSRRSRTTSTIATLVAVVIKPARVKVNVIASATSASTATSATRLVRRGAAAATGSSPSIIANSSSRYIDAIVGYWNGPLARTCDPTNAVSARKNLRSANTGVNDTYSSSTRTLTTAPATAAAMNAACTRAADVAALTAMTNTPKASVRRPTMCTALPRLSAAASAATADAAIQASHGRVSAVRTCATARARTHPAAKHARTSSSSASTVLNDCPGTRTSGVSASNGASGISRQTPPQATSARNVTSTPRSASAHEAAGAVAVATDMDG